MDGDLVVGLSVVVAIIVIAASLLYAVMRSSQGYYDNYGRKIPLDEMKQQTTKQNTEISRLKEQLEQHQTFVTQLETEKQKSSDVVQKLEQLEKRIEALEKRGG
jgi:FtsZ-interacting cell division protein ZipA